MPEEEIILPYMEFNTAHVTRPLNLHNLELFSKIQHEKKTFKKRKITDMETERAFSPSS